MQARSRVHGRSMARRTELRGFTLLELLVAVSVFGIAMAALTLTQVTTVTLSRTNQDTTMALDAAQGILEALRAAEFEEVFALYNLEPGDDPLGGAPGAAFAVRGLTAAPGDPDDMPGEVLFPGDGFELREDVDEPALGMPRDLNLDGGTDVNDHSADYRILPYLVRVRWRGAGGVREVELVGTLARR